MQLLDDIKYTLNKLLANDNNKYLISELSSQLVSMRSLIDKNDLNVNDQLFKLIESYNKNIIELVKHQNIFQSKDENSLLLTLSENKKIKSSFPNIIEVNKDLFIIYDDNAITIASRIPGKEGFYRRSQYRHGYAGEDWINEMNEFAKRLSEADLEEEAALYNIGGNQSIFNNSVSYKKSGLKSLSNKNGFNYIKDRILEHKNAQVSTLINYSEKENLLGNKSLFIDSSQTKASYPCLIIKFGEIYFVDENNESFSTSVQGNFLRVPKGYAEFATHLVAGCINHELKKKNIYPLIERRQSFGFLTPTITDVGTGIRLSLGLTPNEKWLQCVIEGVKVANEIIYNIKFYEYDEPLFENKILKEDAHKYITSFLYDLNKSFDNIENRLCKVLTEKKSDNINETNKLHEISTDYCELYNMVMCIYSEILGKEHIHVASDSKSDIKDLTRALDDSQKKVRHKLLNQFGDEEYLATQVTTKMQKILTKDLRKKTFILPQECLLYLHR